MSTPDFQGNGHDGDTAPLPSAAAVSAGAPTQTLVSSAVGDRCVNCGTPLSSDQRYCVVCGERRGAPRFTLPVASPVAESVTTRTTVRSRRPAGPRFGSGATLVAGVGTLLIALLVGFVIGNAASRGNTRTVTSGNAPIKVINVGGGSSSGSAAAGTSTTASARTSKKTSAGAHESKAKAAKSTVSKKTAAAESSAASKVTGGNGAPPATTKVGQKCSGAACKQAGYNKKTHKFDGSFFGQ